MPATRYLYATNTYHPKVQVSDWHLYLQSLPKDNDPYDPPGGNYFLSTYNRMGTLVEKTPNSETHDMLRQIWQKEKYQTVYPKKPLVNFVSYPTTECELEGQKQLDAFTYHCNFHCHRDPARGICYKEAKIPELPKSFGVMDYRSTMQRDYQPIYPQPIKPLSIQEWDPIVHRLCLSELNDGASVRRRGVNKFFDDNLTEFYKTKKLREWRYSSYDPGVGKYTHDK